MHIDTPCSMSNFLTFPSFFCYYLISEFLIYFLDFASAQLIQISTMLILHVNTSSDYFNCFIQFLFSSTLFFLNLFLLNRSDISISILGNKSQYIFIIQCHVLNLNFISSYSFFSNNLEPQGTYVPMLVLLLPSCEDLEKVNFLHFNSVVVNAVGPQPPYSPAHKFQLHT